MNVSAQTAIDALGAVGVDTTHARSIFVPGRIEFLGKHTDYCGGRSLLCAVEQGICFSFVPRADSIVRVLHPATGAQVDFPLRCNLTHGSGHWSNYLMTVGSRVARNFPGDLCGFDLAFHSNLPAAAGLSSSSALIVGMFLALADANNLADRPDYRAALATPEDLAGYLGCVENGQGFENGGVLLAGDRGVGTMGGSQDHTAILCAEQGILQQYGFCPVRHEGAAALPAGCRLVVGVSGIVAEKTGSAREAYNRNPRVVQEILRRWNGAADRADASLAGAVRSEHSAIDRLRKIIRDDPTGEFPQAILLNRLNQFVEESERIIPAAADALRRGDLAMLGTLVDESQRLAEIGLGNQTPQTIFLARAAREAGAIAASAFGAGFGGSVWAMVREQDLAQFSEILAAEYRQAFPDDADLSQFFVTRAAPAAGKIT